MEATHEITACYFPNTGEVELTWEDIETHEKVEIIAKVNKKTGEQISRVVMPCVYHGAVIKR